MPVTFFILLYWKRQQKVFLQNLATLRSRHDAKAIHDLRVAVKKLRAYLKLLNRLINETATGKSFEKTEQLFAVLGKYRDIGMGLSLIEEFEKANKINYTAFRYQLKSALQRTEIWVKDALGKYDEKELADLTIELQQTLKKTDVDKLPAKAKAIIDKEIKNLKQDAKHFSDRPHVMRKALKNIFYWITSFPKDPLVDAAGVKKLKKSLDELGDWQDLEMLYEKVKHFRKDFVPDARNEYELLKSLEQKIEEKMEVKLRKAEDNFKEFMAA
jgi:CHAD domain-containing protein